MPLGGTLLGQLLCRVFSNLRGERRDSHSLSEFWTDLTKICEYLVARLRSSELT